MISHLQTISTSFPIVVVISRFQILCGGGRIGKIAARDARPTRCIRRLRTPPSVRIFKCHARKAASIERMPSDACDAVPNRYARKAAAIIERITSDARHAVGNGDARQPAAIRERITSDARHAVGNSDARKAAATTERLVSDARHATV